MARSEKTKTSSTTIPLENVLTAGTLVEVRKTVAAYKRAKNGKKREMGGPGEHCFLNL